MKNRTVFSRMLSTRVAAVAGALCLLFAAGAQAEAAKPCADDAARLCKGVPGGEGRIAKCMKEHESELSPACRAKIAEFREEIKEFAQACKEDAAKTCRDVQPGGGRIVQCLKAHEASLSPPCKEKMLEVKARKPPEQRR